MEQTQQQDKEKKKEELLINLTEIKQRIKKLEEELPVLKKTEKACEDFLKLKK